jgi:hypothetical protein
LGEVGCEDIGVDYLETGFGGEFLAKMFDQEGVELDGDDAGGALEEFLSEGTSARADF